MKEVNEKFLKEIYLNILKAIIVVLYFFVLNVAYENISIEKIEIGIKIFAMIFLFVSIYIFEKAYKKDEGKIAIQGIEIFILALYTISTEHIVNKFNFNFKRYSLVASYIFAIYFILKCIVIYTQGRKEIAEDLSDIRQIVKKDEPVKKEATKKVIAEDSEDKEVKKTKKIKVEKQENKDKEEKEKKTSKPKKENKENEENETKTKTKRKTNSNKTTTKTTVKKSTSNNTSTKKDNLEKTDILKETKQRTTKKKGINQVKEIKKENKSEENKEEKSKRKRVKKEVVEND